MFSNRYIFTFTVIMVTAVALMLSVTAIVLQPYQQKNLDIEKMKGILGAAQIFPALNEIETSYQKKVVREIVLDSKGNEIAVFSNNAFQTGNIRAFNIVLKDELKKIEKTGNGNLPIYQIKDNEDDLYIIPLYGRGLWGPIWGTVALKADMNTVVGAIFSHKSETPGLGAEIDTKKFQEQFHGKMIFDKDGNFVSVQVLKGGVKNNPSVPEVHGVDAISGGTITSKGTSEMLYHCLKLYIPYFERLKQDNQNEK